MGRTAPMRLSKDERRYVQSFVERGEAIERTLTRARILLKSDEGWIDSRIAEVLDVSEQTVRNTRKRFRDGGVEAVLADKQRQRRSRKALLSEEQAAHLIAIASSEVPTGHDHWTVRMLADKAVELGYVQRLSRETVRLLLKKSENESSPLWWSEQGG